MQDEIIRPYELIYLVWIEGMLILDVAFIFSQFLMVIILLDVAIKLRRYLRIRNKGRSHILFVYDIVVELSDPIMTQNLLYTEPIFRLEN